MSADYYDRKGRPMTFEEWGAAFEKKDRVLGRTPAGDGEVSTVWLGLNHRFGDGPPLIYETMIFGGKHDQDQWRYATEEEAVAGHEKAVVMLERIAERRAKRLLLGKKK